MSGASTAPACPRCGAPGCVPGRIEVAGNDSGSPSHFYPEGLRFFTLVQGVPLSGGAGFLACVRCGLTWNELPPAELLQLLRNNGTPATQAAFKDT
jgi:hypothetical protein